MSDASGGDISGKKKSGKTQQGARAMSGLVLRAATPADHAAVWDMLRPVFHAGETYAIDPAITQSDAMAYWFGPGREVRVAEAGGTVLGTYYIRPNNEGGGAHVCNCGFVTAAAAQGKGVARAMLTEALDRAAQSGYRAMQFNFVISTNTRAVALWQSAGFQIAGRLPGAYLHPEQGYVDALVMYRSLLPDGAPGTS
jgi:ribosomal protein S18 acetylase RimI-like enzyme